MFSFSKSQEHQHLPYIQPSNTGHSQVKYSLVTQESADIQTVSGHIPKIV